MAFVIATVKPIKIPKTAMIATVVAILVLSKEFIIVLRIISLISCAFKAVTPAFSSKRPKLIACVIKASFACAIVASFFNFKFSLPIKLTAATMRFSSFVKLLYRVFTATNPA